MSNEIGYSPFGDTRSTYRTPEARARRRGSWVKTVAALAIAAAVGTGGAAWSLGSAAEKKAQESVDRVYSLASIASSTPEQEITEVMESAIRLSREIDNPGQPVDQDEVEAKAKESMESVTGPIPEITLGSSSGELRRALGPSVALCAASLSFPPEQPGLSTLYTTCENFQDEFFKMIQDVGSYNETVTWLGPLSWGRETVPELTDGEGVQSILDPAMLGGR